MEIPESIKILGKKVKVMKVHPSEIDDAGEWDTMWYMIRLKYLDDPLFPRDKIEEAFLHEIFEAVNDFCDLDISHRSLTVLSECFFQVIRENKLDFRKVLYEKETN